MISRQDVNVNREITLVHQQGVSLDLHIAIVEGYVYHKFRVTTEAPSSGTHCISHYIYIAKDVDDAVLYFNEQLKQRKS